MLDPTIKKNLFAAHLIALTAAAVCWALDFFNIVTHDFPILLVFPLLAISFFSAKLCANLKVCKNLFCLALFIPIFLSALNTGGIYSFDFIGMIAVPIIAIILLNNKWGALWTGILLCAVFYFFRLEYLAEESYILQLEKFDLTYFITISLIFFLSTIGLVMLLRYQINKKQMYLDAKTYDLDIIAEELKENKKQQNNFFSKANHDLKQPLRNIKSFAKLLSQNLENEPELNKENLEFLEYIIEGSNELSSTVEELANTDA